MVFGANNYLYTLGEVSSAASVLGEKIANKTGLKYKNVKNTDSLRKILTENHDNVVAVFFDNFNEDEMNILNCSIYDCNPVPLLFCTYLDGAVFDMADSHDNITFISQKDCGDCVVGNLIFRAVNEHINILNYSKFSDNSVNYFNNAPVSYFLLDETGICIDVNRKWVETLGYSREESKGRDFKNFVIPDYNMSLSGILSGIIKEGKINDLRLVMKKKNGESVNVSLDANSEKNPDGTNSILCTFRESGDIDVLKWDYERLKKSYLRSYDPMGWLNIDGTIRDTNVAATKLLGYSNEELKNMDLWDFYDNIPRDKWGGFLEKLRNSKGIVLDLSLKNSDGFNVPVKINASVLNIGNDELILLHGQETSRIIAQQEILNRELLRYEHFFSNFQGIAYLSAVNGEGIFVKGSTEKITGYSEEDFSSRKVNWMRLIHPDDFKIIRDSSDEIQTVEGFKKVVDYRIITKSGEIRWVRDSVQNYFSGENKTTFVSGFILDITEQKKAEDELIINEERYRALSNASDQIVVVLDGNNNILYINDFFSDLLKYSPKVLEGCRLNDSFIPGNTGELQEMYEKCVSSGKILETNFSFNIEGNESVFHIRFTPQKEYDGSYTYLLTGNDITESVKIEKAVLKANQKLNILSEITRHDTLNCITALEIYEDLLSGELEGDSNKEKLELIISLTRQIENIAVFTRDYQELGGSAPGWNRIDRVVNKLKTNVNFSRINIINLEDELEVFADVMIEKVFYTLFDNAMRHGGENIDAVKISFSAEDRVGIIRVEDDGKGVPDENKKKIFMRSFGENTGLGLFLAKEILSITDITIEEVGESGRGACFLIKIPPDSWKIVS